MNLIIFGGPPGTKRMYYSVGDFQLCSFPTHPVSPPRALVCRFSTQLPIFFVQRHLPRSKLTDCTQKTFFPTFHPGILFPHPCAVIFHKRKSDIFSCFLACTVGSSTNLFPHPDVFGKKDQRPRPTFLMSF